MGPTHAQLSEPSVSEHVPTHDRKGREGKGIGREGNRRGSRVETSHPFVQYLSARAASEPSDAHQPHATATAWMAQTSTTARDDTTTGLATIEGINLDVEVPCTPDDCEHAAELMIRTTCPECQHSNLYGICRDVWTTWGALGSIFLCTHCGGGRFDRDDVARIVQVLR